MTAAASMPLPPPPLSSQEIPSWQDLQQRLSSTTVVGQALDADLKLRHAGKGSPHVHNHLRLFADGTNDETKDNKNKTPKYTLYRDHAGWCPYCQKTMLLIEAKEIPIAIELINMRSYGDKPQQFLRKVPNGLLPAIENNDSGEIILDSAYIMEFLDQEYSTNNNNNAGSSNKQMIPDRATQPTQYQRYEQLLTLERELFSWWCTFMFRAEQPPSGGSSGSGSGSTNLLQNLFGGGSTANTEIDNSKYVSPTQNGFLNCLATVNTALTATDGPFFLDYATPSHPTMIDFIYASHIERMFASAAYWKGTS